MNDASDTLDIESEFFGSTPQAGDSPSARYQNRIKAARRMLMLKGLVPRGSGMRSSVFISSADIEDDSDLSLANGARVLPHVVEAVGYVAAERLAQKSHRLATQEEIERFHREQQERNTECFRIEQLSRERDGKAGSARDIAAAIREAIAPAKEITEPAAPASSGRTEKRQGKETN